MKKTFFLFLLLSLFMAAAFARVAFTPIYWIKGTVPDMPGISPNGGKIFFENGKAFDTIGESGRSRTSNRFLINAGDAEVPLEVGKKYKVFTESMAGYGIGPMEIELSGTGVENLGSLPLEAGKGVTDIRALVVETEPSPDIKVWFNNRLYQKALVDKGIEYIVPKKPKIKMEVNIPAPYALASQASEYTFTIGGNTYSFSEKKIEHNKAVFEITLSEELEPGKNTVTFRAKSSGAKATGSTAAEIVNITVAGGPLRLLDDPICFPSPFNPERDKFVTIQYTLSENADVDIFIFDIAANIAKKLTIRSGEEGGTGQVNKVKWNGVTDGSFVAGNGVYVGNIVSKTENKVLGKFKLTVYR